jgi:hypothetical protein
LEYPFLLAIEWLSSPPTENIAEKGLQSAKLTQSMLFWRIKENSCKVTDGSRLRLGKLFFIPKWLYFLGEETSL